MFSQLERPTLPRPGLNRIFGDLGFTYVANGLIGFIFSATGPVAIILSVGTGGGLSEAELASWLFGVFFINGLITIAMSWWYKTPLGFAWTIPGTVLVGPALQHLSFAEVIGAFYATSLLILVMGASGWVKRLMQSLPMPIVMGMVAGVFLRFGLDLVRALHSDPMISAPMVVAFLLLSASPAFGKRLPPVIGALLVGALVIAVLGRVNTAALGSFAFASPVFQAPVWTAGALIELVVPLAITVLVVQNGQGVAVLKGAGHEPPVNTIAFVSGIGAAFSATVGAVSTCLTGPTNALLTSSGEHGRQYSAALVFGIFGVLFGLMAPTFTNLMLAAPKEYIMVLGGLAMLRVLQGAFISSFGSGKFTLGALISLVVTVADLGILNIGAAFWGLVAGFVVSWLMERQDFVALANRA
ncbi:benzoate/H(+) symporter BenE family transporter [Cognatazoarcus halotolerans]|uniref:benzoate/H(+) symporter BenE family transporter n=1 Tax=Cognatazoarcus halotolerans TaxID=2686016 RepID=UPI00135B1650|nr:benzoate/H(+) symporter BenE family transporter [Cognatazoarcus halotolerans]MBX3678560.1 benzoate/H(+) symporter BenE family transporter [Rhodocyclaceae bacterium]MCB1898844.1 benzoate/H(+) symporter BenE family transporter [Rhodocyclaceae bacterium]MCP5308519.1 benzoate/H(+) symporter BenE family transporter [Zoogloeaceae bacterium]